MPTDYPLTISRPRETIFAGIHASFYSLKTSDLSAIDVAEFAAVDMQLGRLGFERLGNLRCSTMPEAVIRCYGRPECDYGGFHVRCDDGRAYTDFYTEFSDGSSLTTSTNRDGASFPAARIFRRVAFGEDPKVLEILHRAAIAEHAAARGTSSTPARADLTACAAMIERFLNRFAEAIGKLG